MHPTLFDFTYRVLGLDLAIHTYGLLVGLGFVVGTYFAVRQGRKSGLAPADMLDLCFWLIVSGLMGGRLGFMAVNIREYLAEPFGVLRFWEGGFVWYGGFIGALAAGWLFVRFKSIPFLKAADSVIPGVAIGHAVGRLGCFAAGCCWGRACSPAYPLGVVFTDPEALAPKGIPLHPVQLYEAAGEGLIFLVLLRIAGRRKYNGQVLLVYMTLYPVLRAVLETFRGDFQRGFLIEGVLSSSQFVSLLVFAAALVTQVVIHIRAKRLRFP
jgi:phosphatidylglycerol:prolipoprotein diacylglycerol transferase